MMIVKMQEEEKMVEIMPPFTPDLAAKVKQDKMAYWIIICTKHLLRGAENLYQVIMYKDLGAFGISEETTGFI